MLFVCLFVLQHGIFNCKEIVLQAHPIQITRSKHHLDSSRHA